MLYPLRTTWSISWTLYLLGNPKTKRKGKETRDVYTWSVSLAVCVHACWCRVNLNSGFPIIVSLYATMNIRRTLVTTWKWWNYTWRSLDIACLLTIFHKVDVAAPRLGRGFLWFDSCKRPPPVSDQPKCKDWVVAYGRFYCIFCFSFDIDRPTRLWTIVEPICSSGVINRYYS